MLRIYAVVGLLDAGWFPMWVGWCLVVWWFGLVVVV